MIPRSPEPERGLVLAVLAQGADADAELAEVEELARTAGVEPVARIVQHRGRPAQRTYVGKGKLEEVQQRFAEAGADLGGRGAGADGRRGACRAHRPAPRAPGAADLRRQGQARGGSAAVRRGGRRSRRSRSWRGRPAWSLSRASSSTAGARRSGPTSARASSRRFSSGSPRRAPISEVEELARTAGVEPVARIVQHRGRPAQRTYVGKGKLEEVQQRFAEAGADLGGRGAGADGRRGACRAHRPAPRAPGAADLRRQGQARGGSAAVRRGGR